MSRKVMFWVGWVLTITYTGFILYASAVPKLMGSEAQMGLMAAVGWPDPPLLALGIIETVTILLYVIPQTAILGAVLHTGYLGGAAATSLHANGDLFSLVLLGVYFGIWMWAGLFLRYAGLRRMFPFILTKGNVAGDQV